MDLAAAYEGVRGRLDERLRKAGGELTARRVPASPDWTVKDVVAHLCGLLGDVRAGNLEGVGTDAWTAKQVEDREAATIDAIFDEWAEHAAALMPSVPEFPRGMVIPLINDACTHELDIHGALGDPTGRDTDAVAISLDGYLYRLNKRLNEAGLGLRVRAGDLDQAVGTGDPAATVTAEPFEMLRALTGRRSPDQVRSLGWEGDPELFIPLFSTYPMRAEPLEE